MLLASKSNKLIDKNCNGYKLGTKSSFTDIWGHTNQSTSMARNAADHGLTNLTKNDSTYEFLATF